MDPEVSGNARKPQEGERRHTPSSKVFPSSDVHLQPELREVGENQFKSFLHLCSVLKGKSAVVNAENAEQIKQRSVGKGVPLMPVQATLVSK